MTIGDVTGVLALLLTGVYIIKGWLESKNLQKSGVNLDADTIEKLQGSLNRAIESNTKIAIENAQMRTELETLKKKDAERDRKFDEQSRKIQELERIQGDLKDWADRLCKQLKDNRIEPVKFVTSTDSVIR